MMKIVALAFLSLLLARTVFGAEPTGEKPVVLPRVVVSATPGQKFFSVSWESKLPLPFSKVTRAWIEKVHAGRATEDAGIKEGDELLRIDGIAVNTMTNTILSRAMRRERQFGTQEEFVIRTGTGEIKTVLFVYEPEKKKPDQRPATAPSGLGSP